MSHIYFLEHALQLSSAHVWVPPGTSLKCLQQRNYLVEYSLDTSMTQSIVGIGMSLLDESESLTFIISVVIGVAMDFQSIIPNF
jgi:hypothetical protein